MTVHTPTINNIIPTHCFLLISLFLNKYFEKIRVKTIPKRSIALGIPGFGANFVEIATVVEYIKNIKPINITYKY